MSSWNITNKSSFIAYIPYAIILPPLSLWCLKPLRKGGHSSQTQFISLVDSSSTSPHGGSTDLNNELSTNPSKVPENATAQASCKGDFKHFFLLISMSGIKIWMNHCLWKKSCTTWKIQTPVNNGMNYLPSGAGFLPSTVWYASWLSSHVIGGISGLHNPSQPHSQGAMSSSSRPP